LWDAVLGLATHAGEPGHRLMHAMHHAILSLLHNGCNVLADHVLVESAWVEECVELFADLPAWMVSIYCPLEVLEERERSRKNRTLGQARAQFPIVHAYTLYDLEVDTSQLSAAECAAVIREGILHTPPSALQRLRQRQAKEN
jgi:chloramphenicol 3-O phosphotransferase